MAKSNNKLSQIALFDRTIIFVSLILLLISIALIYSASVQEAFNKTGDAYFYVKRQTAFIVVAVTWGILMTSIPSKTWFDITLLLMGIVIILLIVVLIVGREINEAKRWISLGPVNLQPAEFLKLFWIIYFSSYISRKIDKVRNSTLGFVKPIIMLTGIAALLLLQPDFGSLVVVTAITLGILFVAGAGLLKYLILTLALSVLAGFLIWLQPYRVARVVSFLDPWQDQYGSGYQLTQSLMAFGRGGLTGEGVGNSIHKLGYLPEAHTDFVMSILGEELGFIGVCFVILLEFIIVFKAILLAIRILRKKVQFQGYVAFGIGTFFCLQTVINIAVASGALPTKGLTLPMVSYGGSSLIVCLWALAILLRIDFEYRTQKL